MAKPKTHREQRSRIRFFVEGHGRFPVDMLRYDHAHPASSVDATAIADTFNHPNEEHRIFLEAWPAAGTLSPSVRRWESFGWLVYLDDEKGDFIPMGRAVSIAAEEALRRAGMGAA